MIHAIEPGLSVGMLLLKVLRSILFIFRGRWGDGAIFKKRIQKRLPSGEAKRVVFKAYRVPAQQQFSQQVPVSFLTGNDDKIREKSADPDGPQPALQIASQKAESTGKDYYVRDGIDSGIGQERRREGLTKDGLSAQVADRRERVPDTCPVKSSPQFDLTMGQPFDLREDAHIDGMLETFPEFSGVTSQLMYRRTKLGIVNDLRRKTNYPVSEVGPPACGLEKSRGAQGESGCHVPGYGGMHAQHYGQLDERLRAKRAINIVLVEWGEAIQMLEYPIDRQGC